jgi:hypothetical protein
MVGLGWSELMILVIIGSFAIASVVATVLIVLALTKKNRQ